MKTIVRTLLSFVFVALLFSCGGGGEGDAPRIVVEGEWARATPLLGNDGGGSTNSAIYLSIRNLGGGADRLLGGESPAAAAVQLHESRVVEDVMSMRRIDGLDIPPGGSVELEPGGMHIMLLGLTAALVGGEDIDLTLHFLHSGDLRVSVPVKPSGGM